MFSRLLSIFGADAQPAKGSVSSPQATHGRALYAEEKRTGVDAGRAGMTLYSDGSFSATVGGKAGAGRCRLDDYDAIQPTVWRRRYFWHQRGVEEIVFLSWASVHKGSDGKKEVQLHHGRVPEELRMLFSGQSEPAAPPAPVANLHTEGFRRRCLTVHRDRA